VGCVPQRDRTPLKRVAAHSAHSAQLRTRARELRRTQVGHEHGTGAPHHYAVPQDRHPVGEGGFTTNTCSAPGRAEANPDVGDQSPAKRVRKQAFHALHATAHACAPETRSCPRVRTRRAEMLLTVKALTGATRTKRTRQRRSRVPGLRRALRGAGEKRPNALPPGGRQLAEAQKLTSTLHQIGKR
jgi:hypothetical protein